MHADARELLSTILEQEGAQTTTAGSVKEALSVFERDPLARFAVTIAALVRRHLDLGTSDPWAIAKLAVVVLGYASGPLVIERKLSDLPTLPFVTVSLGACAVAYAPFGIARLPATLPPLSSLAAVAALGLVCTALAFVLFSQLIAEVGSVRATVVTYVNPAVAVVAGVAILGEPFTAGTAAGLLLILAGFWVATSSRAAVAQRVAQEPG